ncbi:MAG: helix-turn-helix domain-containing protein [Sphingobacteriaceae bacterium]|nr:helix-turn-helix domain-containing protein [Sphingobacteriaceae bacterium]
MALIKSQLIKIHRAPNTFFTITTDHDKILTSSVHHHLESEIIYIARGTGQFVIGKSQHKFSEGDVIFIGPGIPHCFFFQSQEPHQAFADAETIHFYFGAVNQILKNICSASNSRIQGLLANAKKGILIPKNKSASVAAFIQKIAAGGKADFLHFLNLMFLIDEVVGAQNIIYKHPVNYLKTKNINKPIRLIWDYILANYTQAIDIRNLAGMANISPKSFSRYFKTESGYNYISFLMELRINYACELLRKDDLTIKQVCFQSGFNSLTGFHRQFKKNKGITPLEFLKKSQLESKTKTELVYTDFI